MKTEDVNYFFLQLTVIKTTNCMKFIVHTKINLKKARKNWNFLRFLLFSHFYGKITKFHSKQNIPEPFLDQNHRNPNHHFPQILEKTPPHKPKAEKHPQNTPEGHSQDFFSGSRRATDSQRRLQQHVVAGCESTTYARRAVWNRLKARERKMENARRPGRPIDRKHPRCGAGATGVGHKSSVESWIFEKNNCLI